MDRTKQRDHHKDSHRKTAVYIILILLIGIALFIRIWNAQYRDFHADEGISLLATKGILRDGVPTMKYGAIYFRSLLSHYLLAIPLYFGGTGELVIRSLSIVLSLLVLVLVFVIGKDLYDEYVALLAVMILTFSEFENWHATSVRFYMNFQLFFTLAVFFFYKGFIEEKGKYKFWCILFSLCSIFTHRISVELIPIFGISLLIANGWKFINDKYVWAGIIITGTAFYITCFYKPPNACVASVVTPLVMGSAAGRWPWFFYFLDSTIMHSLSVVIMGLLYVYFEKDRKLFFYYFTWGLGMIIAALTAPRSYDRYIFNLFPLYVLLFSYSFTRLAKSIYFVCENPITRLIDNSKRNKVVIISTIAISFSCISFQLVRNSDFNVFFANTGFKKANIFVKENIQKQDLLVSTAAWVTEFYIREPDYFLRQKKIDDEWKEFEFKVDTQGYGYRMLDSLAELKELMSRPNKIWLVADRRFHKHACTELTSFIKDKFKLVYSGIGENEKYKVYLWNNS